ncbi:DUF547 domain-containing protein [Exilibacterium tricleocarpae]|uniref:DUF547 domain-containing protein n=1 Tax=Exilibacterium tricleocarpae TaxID=2591008 RepID=A0A545U9H5_9GAMM|nr:DUF547 domain-containing protein [Exilibacterium tricleocarpae]TQV86124.1 DUF547 domain-containing protein [Exilibacterium tricleocarpae]
MPVTQHLIAWRVPTAAARLAVLQVLLLCLSWTLPSLTAAGPKAKLIDFWTPSNNQNSASIDHSEWQEILDSRLDASHPSGVNRFDYAAVTEAERVKLQNYLQRLQAIDIRDYSRPEQKAFWFNLYNALTVELILHNYPVKSITKLGKRFFSFGPWNDNIAEIAGQKLSLNDIEHGIMRPIWPDNRIHYGVNCASIGCPNLAATAFTAANTDSLLDRAARDFVNHPRGVQFKGKKLLVSSIYHWYIEDFGDNHESLIEHLIQYAEEPLATQLRQFDGKVDHDYDWDLNEP